MFLGLIASDELITSALALFLLKEDLKKKIEM